MQTRMPPQQMRGQDSGAKVSLAVIGAFVLFCVITLYLSVFSVKAGTAVVVKRWGEPVRVLTSGLNWKVPYMETADVIELRNRIVPGLAKMETASNDPMMLDMAVAVNYVINKDALVKLVTEYGDVEILEQRILTPRASDAVKQSVSQFKVNDILRDRNKLRDSMVENVKIVLPSDIVTVTGVSIVDAAFPPEYMKQIRDKQVAREAAETERFVLEKQDLQAQQLTQTANAQANATKLAASADAFAIETKGNAEVAIIEKKNTALRQSPMLIEYEKVQRWGGAFPTTFMGGEQANGVLWQMPAATTPRSTTQAAR